MISLSKEIIEKLSDELKEPLKDCLVNFYDENIKKYEHKMLLLGMLHQINNIYKITAYMIIDSAVQKEEAKKMIHKLIIEDILNNFK